MKEHEWEVETVDGGHLGEADFWKCKNCGASGGPVLSWKKPQPKPPTQGPFYADGTGLRLSADCDEARAEIERHNSLSPEEREREKWERFTMILPETRD